jgi:sulfonate transport system ATP-binding protein
MATTQHRPTEVTTERPAAPDRSPAVVARGVTRTFDDDKPVLDGLDLTINRGELVALLGASGSGKSTLLRALEGLDPEVEGEIEVPERRAVVFQEHRLLPWKKVLANVVLGLDGSEAKRRAEAMLTEVGLAERTSAWPKTLSGGEAQRASIARALVRDPELLLMDEPFGALDALTRIKMHKLLLGLWQRHGFAVLFITHDVDEALVLADRALVLDDGRIVEELAVTAERPRRPADPAVDHLRGAILKRLGVEP